MIQIRKDKREEAMMKKRRCARALLCTNANDIVAARVGDCDRGRFETYARRTDDS